MRTNSPVTKPNPRTVSRVCGLVLLLATSGCVSVPPQVAKLHQKELEIITSLEEAHLAMVDSFVDQKLLNFEHFFFREYGPVFLKHWVATFKEVNGREYDPDNDFPALYNDLVATYQAESAPIEEIRVELRSAIAAEYRNAVSAHQAVGGWLDSVEKLNAAQRKSIDGLLGSIKPGLSLDSVETAIERAKANAERRIAELTQ